MPSYCERSIYVASHTSNVPGEQDKKAEALAELKNVAAGIDEKTQPLQKQLAVVTSFRRQYPDVVVVSSAVAMALPSLLRRSLFRTTLWAGVGAGGASFALEWLRIQDAKSR